MFSSLGSSSSPLARDEHSLYVWKDMSLRELVVQLRSINPNLRSPGNARFSIRHIYSITSSSTSSEATPRFETVDLGLVHARDLSGKNALSEASHGRRHDPFTKTLEQHRFVPGDFLDIAYMTSVGAPGGPPGAAGSGTIGSLQNSVKPGSGPFRAPNGQYGLSEADQAWGIAGEAPYSRDGRGGGGGRGRVNPLLMGRGGMSISGRGGRQPSGSNGIKIADRDSASQEREPEIERSRSPDTAMQY